MIPWAEVPSGGIKQQLLLIYDTLSVVLTMASLGRERHRAALGGSGRQVELDVFVTARRAVSRWHGAHGGGCEIQP